MLESKNELRKKIKAIFKTKNTSELALESAKIMSKLENSNEFKAAKTIALYSSLEDEPSTSEFIEKWAALKTILLPVVRGEDMFFCPYNIGDSLTVGDFSILEPSANCFCGEIDLVVVPAVAYDKTGVRLGRGKGYYDMFFAKNPALKSVGVCFYYALFDSLPSEAHDKKVDFLVF